MKLIIQRYIIDRNVELIYQIASVVDSWGCPMSAEVVNLTPSLASDLPSKSIVASEIRSRITTGRLPLGARISDKQLAAELHVSRTPVREALVQLKSEGLVIMRPQSGTFVVDLTIEDVARDLRNARHS